MHYLLSRKIFISLQYGEFSFSYFFVFTAAHVHILQKYTYIYIYEYINALTALTAIVHRVVTLHSLAVCVLNLYINDQTEIYWITLKRSWIARIDNLVCIYFDFTALTCRTYILMVWSVTVLFTHNEKRDCDLSPTFNRSTLCGTMIVQTEIQRYNVLICIVCLRYYFAIDARNETTDRSHSSDVSHNITGLSV